MPVPMNILFLAKMGMHGFEKMSEGICSPKISSILAAEAVVVIKSNIVNYQWYEALFRRVPRDLVLCGCDEPHIY